MAFKDPKDLQGLQSLQRHPLSAEYADLPAHKFKMLCDSMEARGFDSWFPIITDDDMVLDGWQRLQAAIKTGTTPRFKPRPPHITAEDYVKMVNDARRHETPEEEAARVQARRERVAASREGRKSIGTISKEEGVSRSAIVNDLDKLRTSQGVQGCTTETSKTQGKLDPTPENKPENPEKVTGSDGKSYPAAKVKQPCQRCARVGKKWDETCSMCNPPREKRRTGENQGPLFAGSKKPDDPVDLWVEIPGSLPSAITSSHHMKCPHCGGSGWVAKPTRSERDELFDAIADVTGADKKAQGPQIGALVSMCLKGDPPYTADEVSRLPGVVRSKGLTFPITLSSFKNYLGWLRKQPAGAGLFAGIQEWLEGQGEE